MVNYTRSQWLLTTAQALVLKLPLQTYESALSLATSYLTATGGWEPDDTSEPNGPGQPMSGYTPTEAAADIVEQQLDRIYRGQYTLTATFRIHDITNLDAGLNYSTVINTIEPDLKEFVKKQLDNTKLEIENLEVQSGVIFNRGHTTKEERVEYNNAVISTEKIIDPLAIALKSGRESYNLDNKWNVYCVYKEGNSPIIVSLRKYETLTYENLDTSEPNHYSVNLNPDNYYLTNGTKLKD